MLMCRFYAGLIHHAPLARKLDYYLRIDGDSRLSSVTTDVFETMAGKGAKYGTMGGSYKEITGSSAALPHYMASLHPTAELKTALWTGSKSCPAGLTSCSSTTKAQGPGVFFGVDILGGRRGAAFGLLCNHSAAGVEDASIDIKAAASTRVEEASINGLPHPIQLSSAPLRRRTAGSPPRARGSPARARARG